MTVTGNGWLIAANQREPRYSRKLLTSTQCSFGLPAGHGRRKQETERSQSSLWTKHTNDSAILLASTRIPASVLSAHQQLQV